MSYVLIISQAELSRSIDDFLTVTAQCAPSILISKPKFHFLVHLPAYIRRFGPAILFSTERYESFNHVFRLVSIHSNRQAPSRDTCNAFAGYDRIKHIVFGGYWFDLSSKRWVRAGSSILEYVNQRPERARFLGLHSDVIKKPGTPFHCVLYSKLTSAKDLHTLFAKNWTINTKNRSTHSPNHGKKHIAQQFTRSPTIHPIPSSSTWLIHLLPCMATLFDWAATRYLRDRLIQW
jgi:hypothetical protein